MIELEKLPCDCRLPPDFEACSCGNADDARRQASALAWNNAAEKANAEIASLQERLGRLEKAARDILDCNILGARSFDLEFQALRDALPSHRKNSL